MFNFLALAVLPFMSSCCKRKQPEPLYVPELHENPYLTTDDGEELAKFGIYYDMDRNKKNE